MDLNIIFVLSTGMENSIQNTLCLFKQKIMDNVPMYHAYYSTYYSTYYTLLHRHNMAVWRSPLTIFKYFQRVGYKGDT